MVGGQRGSVGMVFVRQEGREKRGKSINIVVEGPRRVGQEDPAPWKG